MKQADVTILKLINKSYLMLLPPSTGMVNPVMKVEASLARK